MSRIIAVPDPPERPDPARKANSISSRTPPATTLSPMYCEPWCVDGEGHKDAVHHAEQFCTGVEQRLSLTRSLGALVTRLQKFVTRKPTILVAVEDGDTEAYAEMSVAETEMLIEQLKTALRLARSPQPAG